MELQGLVLHLPENRLEVWQKAPTLALQARLHQVFADRGLPTRILPRAGGLSRPCQRPGDGWLHVVEGGAVQGEGWLNAALAYLTGFWHLDPQGVLADSTARHAILTPQPDARAFADALRMRFVAPKVSRYRQPRAKAPLPRGAVAIFLQGPAPHRRGQAHLTDLEMLAATALAAGNRPVLVKAHPLKPEEGRRAIAAALLEGLPLIETEANVHDVLEACDVTVSLNSAAAIEGMLHGKPAVLCGRADFATLTESARSPDQVAGALHNALTQPRDHDAGLAWYFRNHTLEIEGDGFAGRLTAHLARLGMTLP